MTMASGNRITSASTTSITPMNGRFALVIDRMSTRAMTLVMNSAAPTGGVC